MQCDCGVIRGGGGASGAACGTGDAPGATRLEGYVETQNGSHAGVDAPGCAPVHECQNATDCARGPDLSDFFLSFDFNYMRPTVDGCSQMVSRRGNRDEVRRMFLCPCQETCFRFAGRSLSRDRRSRLFLCPPMD